MAQKAVEDYYDQIARKYDTLRLSKPYSQKIAKIEQDYVLAKIQPGASILEVGPGTGRFTTHLVRKASTVKAIDVSQKMLKQLANNLEAPNLVTQKASIYELDNISNYGQFDTVVCMRVLPHLEDPITALKLMKEAVKIGGSVVFDLWNLYSFVGAIRVVFRRPSHVLTRFYSYPKMLRMIKMVGLLVDDKIAWGYPRIGRFSLDYLGNRLVKPLGYSVIFNAIRQ